MVHHLLIAAAVFAAAAAAGEYEKVLQACGCGTGIQTYNTTTAAYCPTNQYPSCNITKMREQECGISCTGPRARLVYRNNSVLWQSTTSISCVENEDKTSGTLKNSEGQTLFNVMRPNCAYKAPCDACSVAYQPTCPTGMTCKEANMERSTTSDDCSQLGCKDGTLKLYGANGAPMTYNARYLFCTVVGKWTNYSIDGSIVGGTLIDETLTAHCVLPKACEECIAPSSTVNLSALPTKFRTGYSAVLGNHLKAAGSCSEFTCPAGYTLYGFSGTSATATGLEYTSSGKLRCDGNSQWTNGGNENTPQNMLSACLKVVPPCATCASNLIAVTTNSSVAGSKPMDNDQTTSNGTCALRTFTCTGRQATIDIYGTDGHQYGGMYDGGTGSAYFTVSCNAAGTGWEAAGIAIGRVECIAFTGCQGCPYNELIDVTTTGANAKPMDGDAVTESNGCLKRKFTCRGNQASIELWGANDTPLGSVDDQGTGTATFHASCNAAGTAWVEQGMAITRVECSVAPACGSCAKELIAVTTTRAGAKPMDSDVISFENGCAHRMFTCNGTNTSIDVYGAGGMGITSVGEREGAATFHASCNAAGTFWEEQWMEITRVECIGAPGCESCASNLITFIQLNPGAKEMDGDVISTVNGCSQRTLTCSGKQASIELWGADGESLGTIVEDGSGAVTVTLACNAAGAAWETEGIAITAVECTGPPDCKTCNSNLIVVTENGGVAKPMDGDMTAFSGPCVSRIFTCVGVGSRIRIWGVDPFEFPTIASVGMAVSTYTVTCDGIVWRGAVHGLTELKEITRAECTHE